jgi:hypothetical protein
MIQEVAVAAHRDPQPLGVPGVHVDTVAGLPVLQRQTPLVERYIRGQGGAYIALWTAVVVVSVNHLPVVWLVPAAVGAPLTEWLGHRARTADAATPTLIAGKAVA